MEINSRKNLFGLTIKELEDIALQNELPKYTAKQLANWIYEKHEGDFMAMSNLSKNSREKLNKKYVIHKNNIIKVETSNDGTKKYLFQIRDDLYIETAYIPERDRRTLCVSSQIGCKRGCKFCLTAKQGFQGNLNSGEILNQYEQIPERDEITNIVYMGMGEPLDNIDEVLKSIEILTSEYGYQFSHKRITVSTIGIMEGIKEFIKKSKCHLAVSLHTPFHEERKRIMPIERIYPIQGIIDFLKNFDLGRQRRVSFEYILFKDFNDSMKHIKALARLLNGLRCRINLIKFHNIPGVPLQSPNDETINNFKEELNHKGILTTLRTSKGEDISAACGLLSTQNLLI